MLFPAINSFTPLSTIQLPQHHKLHPHACNPSMDLVVLLNPLTPNSSSSQSKPLFGAGAGGKGKAKEVATKTKISLWRTGGSRVWEVELPGRVAGLAWSRDGLHLSVLLSKITGYTLEHLSVHTGDVVKSVPLDVHFPNDDEQWVKMEWRNRSLEWEKPRNGSSLMIIDSLPKVAPVEPPKPANVLPFMRPAATIKEKAGPHPWLLSFPSILPSAPPNNPDIVHISTTSLLAGTFPLAPSSHPIASSPDSVILSLAQISGTMAGFFNVVLRALENAEAAFRDGEKQTMICREDLEACAQQHAMSIPDVHADLFHFLMTGRSGVAVNEWLGSKLTSRTIAKWDSTLDTSFRTILKMITESITPSLERIALLLEELRGWSKTPRYITHLHLREEEITRAIDLTLGFATLINCIRQAAEHELLAAADFMMWLKYEIVRTASHDRSSDELPVAAHDLKLVWSFMKNGFLRSPFHCHFPYLLVRPPTDLLPDGTANKSRKSPRPLDQVIRETISILSVPHKAAMDRPTPSQTDESFASSMSMSTSDDIEDDHTPQNEGDRTAEISMDSRASSPDTVERKDGHLPADDEVKRILNQEPWVWARTLIQSCEKLIKDVVAPVPDGERYMERWTDVTEPHDEWWIDLSMWRAFVNISSKGDQQLWIIRESHDSLNVHKAIAFTLSNTRTSCLALQFFDDDELVLLLENDNQTEKERYLVTVRYNDLLNDMIDIPTKHEMRAGTIVQWGQSAGVLDTIPLAISRCRQLDFAPVQLDKERGKVSLALNGEKGRRLGCVMMERGREIQVFDLEADEDDDDENDEEEEEEEEEMQDD